VWDLAEERQMTLISPASRAAGGMTFHPDNRHIAINCADAVVRIFEIATGKMVWELRGHTKEVFGLELAYAPDGKRLASADKSGVRIWDAATGQELVSLPVENRFPPVLVFSPDGRRLVVEGSGTTRVFDAGPPPGQQ
jgi:WD40 repeat protein